jgi:hypothetical protein
MGSSRGRAAAFAVGNPEVYIGGRPAYKGVESFVTGVEGYACAKISAASSSSWTHRRRSR